MVTAWLVPQWLAAGWFPPEWLNCAAAFLLLFVRSFSFLFLCRPLRDAAGAPVLAAASALFAAVLLQGLAAPDYAGLFARPFWSFAAAAVINVILGAALGLPAALVLEAPAAFGRLCDAARGAMFAEQVSPESGDHVSLLEDIGAKYCAAALLISGGLQQLFAGLGNSVLQSGLVPGYGASLGFGAAWVEKLLIVSTDSLALSLSAAAPVLLVCMFVDAACGVISRFQPRMSLFLESMSLKLLLGLGVLSLLCTHGPGLRGLCSIAYLQ